MAPLIAALQKLVETPEAGLAVRTAALAASLAFFATKVFGVRYLPPSDRPVVGAVVFLLACGLLHSEFRATILDGAEPYVAALGGAASGAVIAGAACRLARTLRRLGCAAATNPRLARLDEILRDAGLIPAPQFLLSSPRSTRGPPR